jgi:hypothetical protein
MDEENARWAWEGFMLAVNIALLRPKTIEDWLSFLNATADGNVGGLNYGADMTAERRESVTKAAQLVVFHQMRQS